MIKAEILKLFMHFRDYGPEQILNQALTYLIVTIRKDCFQVKSNLLTDFRFTTHMNITILN